MTDQLRDDDSAHARRVFRYFGITPEKAQSIGDHWNEVMDMMAHYRESVFPHWDGIHGLYTEKTRRAGWRSTVRDIAVILSVMAVAGGPVAYVAGQELDSRIDQRIRLYAKEEVANITFRKKMLLEFAKDGLTKEQQVEFKMISERLRELQDNN